MTVTDLHRSGDHAGLHTAGWLLSLLLHASLVVSSFFFVQRVHLAPQSEPFTWNVAIVSPVSQSTPSPVSSSLAESLPPVPAVPTTPPTASHIEPAPPIAPLAQPRPVQPTTSFVTPPPRSTPSPQADTQPIKPVPQAMASTTPAVATPMDPVPPAPVPTPVAPPPPVESVKQAPIPVESVSPSNEAAHSETSPIPPQRESDSSVAVAPSHPEPPRPISPDSAASPESLPAVVPHVAAPPAETFVQAASSTPQVATLAPSASNRLARADYGWLSDAILRRVEELKRYPTEARVDRAEGKVVVKAVVHEDGSVDDVEIFQSSGYTTLDKAAIDLMRQAAPFHLPHPLGKPRVTIKIPMSYRLDR